MKKHSLSTCATSFLIIVGKRVVYFLLSIAFFSCAEIQPVTMSGVENVQLKKLSNEGVEFDFSMKIKNLNNMRITVFPSSFDATINGMNVGKIKLSKKVRIKANSDESPVFHVKSDFSKLGVEDIANVISLVGSKRADISLKGDVKAGKWYYKRKFPIDMKKTISLSK